MTYLDSLGFPRQLAVSALCSLALLALGYRAWPDIEQQRELLADRSAELAALSGEIAAGRVLEQRLPELQSEIRGLESTLDALRTAVPDQVVHSQVIRSLAERAIRCRLAIRRIDPQTVRLHETHEAHPIQVDVEGRYHDLALFFDRLRIAPRIFSVDDLALSRDDGSPTVRASFVVTTFVQLPLRETSAPEES